uniref:Uncharacterized protein n=1 Tax=Meloidogyne hapla TaxID=6305 RepID=A0A1I8BDV5_MELHA
MSAGGDKNVAKDIQRKEVEAMIGPLFDYLEEYNKASDESTSILDEANMMSEEAHNLYEEAHKLSKKAEKLAGDAKVLADKSKKRIDFYKILNEGSAKQVQMARDFLTKSQNYESTSADAIDTSHSQVKNEQFVFVWNLENVCSILPPNSSHLQMFGNKMLDALKKLLTFGFGLKGCEVDRNILTESAFQYSVGSSSTMNLPPMRVEAPGQHITSTSSSIQSASSSLDTGTSGKIYNFFERYKKLSAFEGLLKHCKLNANELMPYLDNIEKLPEANIALYRQCFQVIYESGHVNVIITSTARLAGAFGHLLIYRLGEFVEANNVFLYNENNEEVVLQQLANKFQTGFMLFVTANAKIIQLADSNGILRYFLGSNDDLVKFHRNLLDFLVDISPNQPAPQLKEPSGVFICERCNKAIPIKHTDLHYFLCDRVLIKERSCEGEEAPPKAKKSKNV